MLLELTLDGGTLRSGSVSVVITFRVMFPLAERADYTIPANCATTRLRTFLAVVCLMPDVSLCPRIGVTMFSNQSIVYAFGNGLSYALALLDDLTDEQMVFRPGGNMNHPSWILGHISIYYPVVPALLRGEPFDDPADHPLFGFRGRGPLPDLDVYGSKASQIKRFTEGHEQVAAALLSATREQLYQRPSLPRWADAYPTVEFMLPDLLLHHESMHIGQLSMWRRAAGLPAVKMPSTKPRAGLLDQYTQR